MELSINFIIKLLLVGKLDRKDITNYIVVTNQLIKNIILVKIGLIFIKVVV